MESTTGGRSRRAVLTGAAATLVGMAAGALGRPTPAWAAVTPMTTDTLNHAAAQTSISSAQTGDSSAVFAAYSTAKTERIYALFGQANSSNGSGVYGYSPADGIGLEGHSEAATGVVGLAGSGEATGLTDGTGVYGLGTTAGVRGRSATGIGVLGAVSPAEVITPAAGTGVVGNGPRYGVQGTAPASGDPGVGVAGLGRIGVRGVAQVVNGVGVEGESTLGVALHGLSSTGTALKIEGKARFTRSGRVSLPKNRTYVDVDLTALGGISGTALCFANMAYPRSGTWIRAVRPNWPSAGKMRIYMNKVASTTASTQISWLVLEGA